MIKEICDLNEEEGKLVYEKGDKDIKSGIVMNLSEIRKDEGEEKLVEDNGVIKEGMKG